MSNNRSLVIVTTTFNHRKQKKARKSFRLAGFSNVLQFIYLQTGTLMSTTAGIILFGAISEPFMN